MPKHRSVLVDFLVYLAVRTVCAILQMLPLETSIALARKLIRLVHGLDRRHRQVAAGNLRQAFPGRFSEDQIERLVLEVYRHLAGMIVEILFLPRKVRRCNWSRHVNIPQKDAFWRIMKTDRPVLIVTAHYGNWEMSAYCLGLAGLKSHLVARPLDNPFLDRWLRRFREMTGHALLTKNGDLDRMRLALKQGGILCTLGDQDAGQRGVFVDFFGRPASTHKALAFLARKYAATVFVCGWQSTGRPLDYTLQITDIIPPGELPKSPYGDQALTQRITAAIERLVRLDPRQYFWLHRRWKHQPEKSKLPLAS